MKTSFINKRTIEINLDENEPITILEPESIIFFDGDPEKRNDQFLDFKSMIKKGSLLSSNIRGKASLVLSLPRWYYIKIIEIKGKDDMLYEYKNVLFYSNDIQLTAEFAPLKIIATTGSLARLCFHGSGFIGIMSQGELIQKQISEKGVYVCCNNLVSIPRSVSLTPCVYGNETASQSMSWHYLITNEKNVAASIIIESVCMSGSLQSQASGEGIFKRFIKEVVPGAQTLWK